MCALPSLSGSENSIRRSRRPGRNSAGSRVSGLMIYVRDITRSAKCVTSPIGSHEDLDIPSRIETIQLIDKLQHCSLYFIVSSSTIVETSSTNGINFIEEDDTCLLTPRHLEEFPNHTRTFTNILLHQF